MCVWHIESIQSVPLFKLKIMLPLFSEILMKTLFHEKFERVLFCIILNPKSDPPSPCHNPSPTPKRNNEWGRRCLLCAFAVSDYLGCAMASTMSAGGVCTLSGGRLSDTHLHTQTHTPRLSKSSLWMVTTNSMQHGMLHMRYIKDGYEDENWRVF